MSIDPSRRAARESASAAERAVSGSAASGRAVSRRHSGGPRHGRSAAPRIGVLSVFGELLITGGVLVLLFLGWQVWLGDVLQENSQQDQAAALSQTWSKGESTAPAIVEVADPGPPPVATAPGNAEQFATLIVPRFGADYIRPVAEGIGVTDVLNLAIGHYPGTQMPGDIGNAAFAAHRTGHGSPFFDIDKLEVGDSIYFEMEAGWYRYEVRSHEYVAAEGVGVLAPVPQVAGAVPTDRLLTLTSCNPIYTSNERIIIYGVYDSWFPRAGGPPPEIAPLVQATAAG